ncbi:MAG TPA: ATP-binding protein [Verrucomicrobiae bacterium]|nr:ATP-binding protein [Verrucomicrobiae bacterium]
MRALNLRNELFSLVACLPVFNAFAQSDAPLLTRVSELSAAVAHGPTNALAISLSGTVLWADTSNTRFVLHDSSGARELELEHEYPLHSGQAIRLQGQTTVLRTRSGFRFGTAGPIINNDGVHAVVEKSGTVFLRSGMQPIRLEWFNGVEGADLRLEWAGPGFAREPLPYDVLHHAIDPTNAIGSNTHGVRYQCFEGNWESLPDFASLPAIASGVADGFDISIRTRHEHAAITFSGFLHAAQEGVYTFWLRSDDGSRLRVGGPTVTLTPIGEATFPIPIQIIPGQPVSEDCIWARSTGTVVFAAEQGTGMIFELQAGTGQMRVNVADANGLSPAALLNRRVEVTGVCQQTHSADEQVLAGAMLVSNGRSIRIVSPTQTGAKFAAVSREGELPILTTAAEVHRLKRDEAQRGYPVHLRGVVTSVLPEHQAFTLQDASRGIYVVDFSDSRPFAPELNEFLEVEGVTDPSLFAPVVNARRVRTLGSALTPEPVRPNWDQLINGSLDAQFVEMQGIVTEVKSNGISMRTQGGIVHVDLRLASDDTNHLSSCENALIRLRGCLFASWDYVTHQVRPGEVRIYAATITVDAAAPEDLFSIPSKTAPELRLFDPQASAFQRVKVGGQILYARGNEAYISNGGYGIRLISRSPVAHAAGDLVEAVGFPDVSGAAPLLHEAFIRKIGTAPLAAPTTLRSDNVLHAQLDATLVRLEGTLVDVRKTPEEWLLEMQSGIRTFLARIASQAKLPSLDPGSRLALTGVYVAQRGTRAGEPAISSFELLVMDANAIAILARPPWWTLERLLIIVGALLAGLAATMLWITQLHRKVEQRTVQLGAEIQERQRVEHQREMEQERSRIARDLHDELGSGITEIGMLAARSRSATAPEERRAAYLEQMSARARELVTALDEIVWAMNPKHDSLVSLISYFSLYADRFLGLAGISWRLDDGGSPGDQVVSSGVRHQLFLAFKEALNNVVRHADASEVTIAIRIVAGRLELRIADNGHGIPAEGRADGMDGVANMSHRMQRMGGSFRMASTSPAGTVLEFSLPTL